jgi:arabinogalactan endo-1,4-beta-galactosidase
MRNHECPATFAVRLPSICFLLGVVAGIAPGQQPPEPTDSTPLDGETYYVLNQLTGQYASPDNNSLASGARIVQQSPGFSNLSQRWAFTKIVGGLWRVSNIHNGLCLDSEAASAGASPVCPQPCGRRPPRRRDGQESRGRITEVHYVVQNACITADTQRWSLMPTSNGYYTISNKGTGLLIDAALDQTELSGVATQGQQWLLRPVFFRGVDNALLEKQEADRAASGLPWWQDAGQPQDVLEIFKNHGVNMVRLRPTSAPPYANASQAQCSGNACYAETDAQDLDLARRARNLGMSIALSLLFDGGNSSSVPAAWVADTQLSKLQADLYNYVRAEILMYRQAGAMPDLVSIGNEVDTGFLGSIGSPTGANFGGFAALQTTAMQAVKDASADTSPGPAIPAPLTCIHITPAWDATQFFTLVNQNNIPYDIICQSYYPMFHGPLTTAQAAASNPGNKPVEQQALVNAANNIGKPIFIMETGEHYENGFDSNDAWYAPPTPTLQRQFLLDMQGVQRSLPNNLGMGMEYWDPAGVNITNASGGLVNGDDLPDAIYIWNGLTLFDTKPVLLPGIDALGGKLDSTLSYKLVNRGSAQLLSVYQASTAAGAMLDAEPDNGTPTLSQQWRITSNGDGYFQLASLNPGADNTANVLVDPAGSTVSGAAVIQSLSGTGQELEWNVVSAGGGYFSFVNRAGGLVLDMNGGVGAQAGFAVQEPQDNNSAAQQWQIVPVH